jgi:glutamine phosphoribosylpyrophosphate amidotransferase
MKAVASSLNAQWKDSKARAFFIPQYYDYPAVARWLEKQGVKFTTETDTEIVLQLVNDYLAKGLAPIEAVKATLPHLKQAENPHVLTLSPPLNMRPEWFGNHVAYSIAIP